MKNTRKVHAATLIVGLAVAGTTYAATADAGVSAVTRNKQHLAVPAKVRLVPSTRLDARVAEAQRRWSQLRLRSYSFVFHQTCFCRLYNVRVTVRDNVVVGISPLDGVHTLEWDPSRVGTIPQLFERLQRAIAAPHNSIEARFDAVTGAPTSVYVDPERNIADEEWGWTISDISPTVGVAAAK